MNVENIRDLSIEVLLNKSLVVKLADYIDYIQDETDLTEFCSFMDTYIGKYGDKYFTYSLETWTFQKKDNLLFPLLEAIMQLDPTQFEKVSAIICQCHGYEKFKATQKSRDEGIDFIAISEKNMFNHEIKKIAIGQSKKFEKSLVGVTEIRELAGSVFLFKNREFSSAHKIYNNYDVKSFTPVDVFFIASYFFSSPAKSLCLKCDIIPIDIIEITCIFLESIRNGRLKWEKKDGNFNYKAFITDIEKVEIEMSSED